MLSPASIRRRALLAATLLLTGGGAVAPARQLDDASAYRALVGDDLPASDPPPVASGAWAGGSPDTIVVATLEGGGPDGLGVLRVGLMARRGPSWTVLATNAEDGAPDLPRSIDPSVAEVRIEPVAFRIAPREVAVAVDVAETLTTTSTSAEEATLHLYRRTGAKLAPIFSTTTGELTSDKTSGGRETSRRWIVRFTPHLTHGFYDLVVQQRGTGAGRTFTWSGTRYVRSGR